MFFKDCIYVARLLLAQQCIMTEGIFVTLGKYLSTVLCLAKFSVSLTFLYDGTDTHTDIWTDRLFSENIILDILVFKVPYYDL